MPLSRRSRIYSCYLVAFLDLFAVGMLVPLYNRRGRELGASPSVIGLIGSIYGGLQLFSSPYMGKASDKIGRKPILLLSFVGCIAGYFTIGATDTILFYALARLPTGIFKHSMTSARAYVSDITLPGEKADVMGKFNAFGSIGFMIAPIVGGYISMMENGFFKVSLLTCSVYVDAFIFVWFVFDGKTTETEVKSESVVNETSQELEVIDKSAPENTENESTSLHGELRKRKEGSDKVVDNDQQQHDVQAVKELSGLSKFFAYLQIKSVKNVKDRLLIRFFTSLSMMVYRSNYTVMLDIRHGVDPKTTGFIISFGSIVAAISGMCVGRMYNMFKSDSQMMFFGSLMMVSSLLGITVSPNIQGVLLCVATLSLSTAVMRANSYNLLAKRSDPSEKGAVMGIADSITSIARMLSPAIAGFAQEVSVIGPCALATILSSVGVSLVVFFHSRDKPLAADKDKKTE